MPRIPLDQISEPLVYWYQSEGRPLPWRENATPYRIWISEIMLQQTRIEAVRGYFARFMKALPTISHLAACPEDELMALWEGLGYYNRARNLKKAAQIIMEQHEGELPANFEQLRALPGIGDYTAGAIASIAFGLPFPAVDGNVLRVISRLTASKENISLPATKKKVTEELMNVIDKKNPGAFNEGLMELGETICIPKGTPDCHHCPLMYLCLGYKRGIAETLPVISKKKPRRILHMTVFVLQTPEGVLVQKRPDSGLLAGLFELPHVEGKLSKKAAEETLALLGFEGLSLKKLPNGKHIFTHLEWHMTVFFAKVTEIPKESSLTPLTEGKALPTVFRRLLP